jgi:hypothetical protein
MGVGYLQPLLLSKSRSPVWNQLFTVPIISGWCPEFFFIGIRISSEVRASFCVYAQWVNGTDKMWAFGIE